MRKILFISLFFILVSFKHPFYLGVTDLKYNAAKKALQGTVKLFTNDLEDALKKMHGHTVDLINPVDRNKAEKMVEAYLKQHLFFYINNKAQNFDFLGFEQEEDALWMYIELKDCAQPEKVSIRNSLLYDFLPGQMHIIHLQVGAESKSFKLTNPQTQCVLDFVSK